jgi:hypothetical protein
VVIVFNATFNNIPVISLQSVVIKFVGDRLVVFSIQHYVIKFVSDLREVGSFYPSTPVSSTKKTDRHDITEILLKVALNTITIID